MRRHSAHVDADVLAELSAGLVGGRRATRIHAHLAGCERCAGVMAELSAVSVLLAAVPSPAMPESVTARLSAALAKEAAARPSPAGVPARPARPAGRNAPHHHPERGRGVPSRTAWRGLRAPVAARAFAAAAAACVLAAGGYTVMQLTTHGPAAPLRPREGGRALTPGYGPNHGPKGGLLTPPSQRSSAPPGTLLPTFTVLRSGTDFQSANLAAQIERALAQTRAAGAEHVSSMTEEDCVYRVTGGTRPTLVDEARYDGQPATVIALAPSATQLGQAWVVGPRCSAQTNDTLQRVQLPGTGG